MTSSTTELLAYHGNAAIVQLPGRRFPAIAVQGDSFSTLASLARAVATRAERTTDAELQEDAKELSDRLHDLLEKYEAVLGKHGIPLPYEREY